MKYVFIVPVNCQREENDHPYFMKYVFIVSGRSLYNYVHQGTARLLTRPPLQTPGGSRGTGQASATHTRGQQGCSLVILVSSLAMLSASTLSLHHLITGETTHPNIAVVKPRYI